MTDRSVIAYPAILHFSESRHYIWEVSPTNTMAYDTLPHDWSYQGEVMQKKTFVLRQKIYRHDGVVPF
jgi:hypothetical protein